MGVIFSNKTLNCQRSQKSSSIFAVYMTLYKISKYIGNMGQKCGSENMDQTTNKT